MAQAPARKPRAADPIDGRTARAERTNEAVVEALLELIEDGDLQPSATRIAERAGVSLRTVFHHFEDMDSLFATAADRQIQRYATSARPVSADGPIAGRIDAFVAERGRMLESLTPVRRAATLSEPFSPPLASRLRWARERARKEVAIVFAPELAVRSAADRRELLAALAAVTDWSLWEALRAHQALSPAQARRTLGRIVSALLKEG
jgi:AcrR family transcriptional regulator